jgi:hypothetical protein
MFHPYFLRSETYGLVKQDRTRTKTWFVLTKHGEVRVGGWNIYPLRSESCAEAPLGPAPAPHLGGVLDVPKPKRSGLVKKIGPFSKRKTTLV